MISALAGCGRGTADLQNPPPPPVSNVSIAFQPAPPASIFINTTLSLTAVVSQDSSNAGADWVVSCANTGNCGSLSALHTDSGKATTYTPPSAFSGNSQAVNIVAYATADHTQSVLAKVNLSAFGSNLKGAYVLQLQGMSLDPSSGITTVYQFAGVIVMDGNGGITSGEQTVNFNDPTMHTLLTKSDPITGGSYFLGPDGRGTITLNTQDQDVGTSGKETFSFVFVSSSQALIAQTDTVASGSGTMDSQTSTAAPSGGYAFVVSGSDIATASPVAFGGILNIDSPKTISGKNSVTDQNLAGTITTFQSLSGSLSDPDSFGAVTLNMTVPGFTNATTFQFTGYIVDTTHIELIESDNSSGTGSGATAGIAIGQGAATGTFTSKAAFSGTYVFGIPGEDLTSSPFAPDSMTSAALFTADGAGNLTSGFMDRSLQANSVQGTTGAQISSQFTGVYGVDVRGTGRVLAVLSNFVPLPVPKFRPRLFFYLAGNGNPPLVLDGGDLDLNYPSLGAGIAYPQGAAPTFGGKYGFNFMQQNTSSENGGTGQMTADTTTNSVSGSVDTNSGFNPTFGNAVSGTFVSPLSNGRFPGSLASLVFESSPFANEYYAIDASHGFFVETDVTSSGVVSFGYYTARTPVCTGCP